MSDSASTGGLEMGTGRVVQIRDSLTLERAMKRAARSPLTLGAMELADALAGELNVPLSEVPRMFSFDEATEAARKNKRLMHGKRTENMFEYVLASLGQATLITREDAGAATSVDGELPAPDYFVALKDGSRFLIEVKNRRLNDFKTPVILNRGYLDRLTRYAQLKGLPLLIAVYWSNLRQWTINRADDIVGREGPIQLTFVEALRKNLAASFGDRMLMASPPLVCRLWANPNKPRSMDAEGNAIFTINKITFLADEREVVDDREQQLALYFMFHSKWVERRCEARMTGDLLDFIEFESGPHEDEEVSEHPTIQSLGTLAGMISSYYDWLTLSKDRDIVRLTPGLQPGQMGAGLDDGYRGKTLKLWVLSLQPGDQAQLATQG